MGAFGVVEALHFGHGVEHGIGDGGQVAAFQVRVVVDADTSQQCDFFSAQSGYAAAAAVMGR